MDYRSYDVVLFDEVVDVEKVKIMFEVEVMKKGKEVCIEIF